MPSAMDFTGEAYHHTRGDVLLLRELAASCLSPRPVFVNIGACFGTSALALLEGNCLATVFSIDVRPCPEENETCLMTSPQCARRLIQVLGRSQEVALAWPAGHLVHLTLVDGDHSYQGVLQDARRWYDLVAPGGWLLFHDCGTPSLPDVPRAVREVMQRQPDRQVDTLWGYRL